MPKEEVLAFKYKSVLQHLRMEFSVVAVRNFEPALKIDDTSFSNRASFALAV